ncbi:iron-sulfur cluster assembly accessory protein isa2 [Gigaspora margarita]|uniref:Iron-sulfur cluster assembly accessory protein isa2 n=1 Tax=Gigaspora margarita TaxID=4874 RepID=A0A8H3X6E6_GIGMA|nr:iron-sulfur cluster assembly accessory protein isa2 [Gigaspora margarita]
MVPSTTIARPFTSFRALSFIRVSEIPSFARGFVFRQKFRFLSGASSVSSDNSDTKLEITDRAIKQLNFIAQREKSSNNALRIAVDSGGCHGFQYFYNLMDSNATKEDDIIFEKNGAKVVVDEISLGLIKGSKLDYTEELIGSQFQVVDNPQATSGCGCGVSFEIKV